MKIGIDGSRAFADNWGGLENYSYNLIKNLGKVDSENKYIIFTSSNIFRDQPKFPNYEYRMLSAPLLWSQVRLAAETYRAGLDLLFIPEHTIPYVFNRKLKTVVTIHDLSMEKYFNNFRFPGRYYLRQFTRFSAKQATHLIAVSQSTKHDLETIYSIPQRKISVVYEGYDKDIFHPHTKEEKDNIRRKYSLTQPYFIFVSTIHPRKNVPTLIRAFAKLLRESNKPVQLVLAGRLAWGLDEVMNLPKDLGIEDQVKFLGHVPDADLSSLLSGSESMVYPSLYEGFGLVILEAMASGAPVITSNVSSMPEVAGNAALLIDPSNIDDLAQAMQSVMTDSMLKKTLIEKGRDRCLEFSWEIAARESVAVFKQVVNG